MYDPQGRASSNEKGLGFNLNAYTSSGQVPVLITVLSEEEGNPELRMSLDDRLSSLADELPQHNITFSQVQRFGIYLSLSLSLSLSLCVCVCVCVCACACACVYVCVCVLEHKLAGRIVFNYQICTYPHVSYDSVS